MNGRGWEMLQGLSWLMVDWVGREPNLDVAVDRGEAMQRLRPYHEQRVNAAGFTNANWWRAEQVHGAEIAEVPHAICRVMEDGLPAVEGVDGLVTNVAGQLLVIYVADCGPVWLVDPQQRAIGLLHSGKKGTELGMVTRGIETMQRLYCSDPADLIVVLGPCIRPPHYEVDFAAAIGQQARQAGVRLFDDCGICTASDLSLHYSYRKESGRTGRMMAMIAINKGHE